MSGKTECLYGISPKSFCKIQHLRLILDYRMPHPERKPWGYYSQDNTRHAVRTASDLQKLLSDHHHPGLNSLTLGNFTSFTAFTTLKETGKPIEVEYQKTIKAEDYELGQPVIWQGPYTKNDCGEARKPNVKYLRDDLAVLKEAGARLEAYWKPFLRSLQPALLCFQCLQEFRDSPVDQPVSERRAELRWALVPRWLVEPGDSAHQ